MALADPRSDGGRRRRSRTARRLLLPAVVLVGVTALGLNAGRGGDQDVLLLGALDSAPGADVQISGDRGPAEVDSTRGGSDPVETGVGDPRETGEPAQPIDPEPAPDTSDPATPDPGPESPTPPPAPSPDPPPTTSAPTPSAGPSSAAPGTTRPAPSPSWTLFPPPTPQRPGKAEPDGPGAPRRGIAVTTGDVALGPEYWNQQSRTAALEITVANTGSVNERVRLTYTLPPGVSDNGTPGCSPAGGGSYTCAAWPARAGDAFGTTLSLRVDGQAWRQLPLNGSVRVETTTANRSAISDEEGFAILLPSGPPAADLALQAGEVSFDVTGVSAGLDVRLGNLGQVDGDGVIEVLLPEGLSVPELPAGCTAEEERTRCDLGVIPAGGSAGLHLPMDATIEAQRAAPLSGGVVGILTARHNAPRQVQMSFRIAAAAAVATPAATPAPTGSQGVLPGAALPVESDDPDEAPGVVIGLIAAAVTAALVAAAVLLLWRRRRAPAAEIETRPSGPAAIEA